MRFPRQFSLRTFSILCVASALCLAYWVTSARNQQQVANAITEFGGHVTYHKPSGVIPQFLISALGHDYFCAIDVVTLYPTAESPADEQIAVLENYPELENLAIWPGAKGLTTSPTDPAGGLSDTGVDLLLTNNPRLRHLSLLAARITNEAEQKLLHAPSIESLQYQTHPAYGARSGGRQAQLGSRGHF